MIEFLRKFEKRFIKIALANLILITKYIILQLIILILYGVGVHCDRSRFSVFNKFIEKSMLGPVMLSTCFLCVELLRRTVHLRMFIIQQLKIYYNVRILYKILN